MDDKERSVHSLGADKEQQGNNEEFQAIKKPDFNPPYWWLKIWL